jgi:hypothetical protein
MFIPLYFVVQAPILTKQITFIGLHQQQLWKIVIINNFASI